MHCRQCLSGSHHLCPQAQPTIVGHRGGFASHVRAHWAWVFPLPEKLNASDAGPLLCGGVTVFAPLVMHARPTDRVGINGLQLVRQDMEVKVKEVPMPTEAVPMPVPDDKAKAAKKHDDELKAAKPPKEDTKSEKK